MRDLLGLESNIVQIRDLGGSNPLCSTVQSCQTEAFSISDVASKHRSFPRARAQAPSDRFRST
jgi:hypothetical protein